MNGYSVNQWSEERNPPKKKSNVLKIANSRGKRPVMRELKKARDLINGILVELNPNEAKRTLKDIDNQLWAILCEPENN